MTGVHYSWLTMMPYSPETLHSQSPKTALRKQQGREVRIRACATYADLYLVCLDLHTAAYTHAYTYIYIYMYALTYTVIHSFVCLFV